MAKAFPLFAVDPNGSLGENAPLMLHTRLAEVYRFAGRVGDPANVEELHNMRIAAKRLRYTMEIYAPCFPDESYAQLYASVKSVQEQIGDIHDCDVRVPLIRDFLEAQAAGRPEIKIGLDTAIAAEQSKRNKLYLKFRRYWNKLTGDGFHRRFLELLVQREDSISA